MNAFIVSDRIAKATKGLDEAILNLREIRPDIVGWLEAYRLDLSVEGFVETGSTGFDDLVINTRPVASVSQPRW